MTQDDDRRREAGAPVPPTGADRPALDAGDIPELAKDPHDKNAKVDVGSDESFPASDPISIEQPCKADDEPPPSSGYKGG